MSNAINAPQVAGDADENSSKDAEVPWHAAYPAPRNKDVQSISREDLLDWIKHGRKPGQDFILVDLRRADHEVLLTVLDIRRTRQAD